MVKKNEIEKKTSKTITEKVAKPKKEKAPKKEKPLKPKKKKTTTEKLMHILVPEHTKITEKEKEELFKYHNVTIKELPKILISDPAIRHLDVKENDVIKITRKSLTAGTAEFYRGVIND